MLHRGFTAVRDMAGDTASIKSVIDRGLFEGPRIYRHKPPSRRRAGTVISDSSTTARRCSEATRAVPNRSGSCGSRTGKIRSSPVCASS